ncbi:MAG TPA: c-type cytochrome [Gemmatimonadaceae bacterium]|nr:c-type cytochrome [Gemmatimonadaceae bacterium]
MRRFLRWTGLALGLLIVAALLGAGTAYVASERRLKRTYEVPRESVELPADSASIARGQHFFRAVTSCTLCHGEDGGGAVYADMGPVGTVAGPNLTRGRGGIGATLTPADWVRAIRHGVRRDGTSLIMMPSEVFTYLSERDLGAIIAYARQLPPVDREIPRSRFAPLGRALLASGKLDILVAPKTPDLPPSAAVPAAPTAEYGRYLANVSGCHGCHGFGLSGGRVAGPKGLPPASNLTPAGLGGWTEADFVRAMREGRRQDGSAIDEFMPWRVFRRMSDDELRALWAYLRSVPPRQFGNK